MRLFAPEYYLKFKCITHRCRHSCCIGWEIDIDCDTLRRYESAEGGYSKKIKESIDYSDTPHFCLLGDRCPHLSERGLCNIITEYSEEWLADICREHPRFYNDTAEGREVGIGMACEEAARIILEAENYRGRVDLGEVGGDFEDFEFNAVCERERVYELLSDERVDYEKRLLSLWDKYGVSPRLHTDGEWRDILSSLEYLNAEHGYLFSAYSSDEKTRTGYEKALERFLAYLIYRHASSKETLESFRSALGFAFFSERLLASLIKSEKNLDEYGVTELARVISEELEYSEDNTDTITFEFDLT